MGKRKHVSELCVFISVSLSCKGTIVDGLGIFNSALISLNQDTMFRVYDSNFAAWQLTDSVRVPFFHAWYQNAAITTLFSFVKKHKETVFYRLNASSANEFVCIDGYNNTCRFNCSIDMCSMDY